MKMKRILIISTVELSKNGISSCIINYNRRIASDDFEVDIVAPNFVEQDIKDLIIGNNMNLYELPIRKSNTINYFLKLRKTISVNKYDIVHVHGNSCTMAIELVAALLGGARTRVAHSHNTTCEHMISHRLLRPIFEISCNVRFACGKAAGKWLFQDREFTVIKNGIDLSLYNISEVKREELREQFGIKKDEIVLGHVGAFNYQKNHEFLVELMKRCDRAGEKKFKLVLVGDGEFKDKIEKEVLAAELNEKIIFTGNVNNVPDFLQMMDLFLLPSRFEGLPYVLIEAQALMLPCLVSDKVSQESRITESVQFLSTDNIDDWVEKVRHSSIASKFRSNQLLVATWHAKIAEAGYDISRNIIELKKMYLSKD